MNKKIIYLLFTVLIFYGIASAQVSQEPTVSITADATTGTAPLTVNFTSTVNDPFEGKYPLTYDWIFGDNTASTKKNPNHTFTDAGIYTVICKVTFWRSPRVTAQNSIEINVSSPPLVVSIGAEPTSGPVSLTVKFTSTVSGGTGAVDSYVWNFGDGSTSAEANPIHIFNTAGTYNVTCTVTDTGDTSLTDQASININVTNFWPAAVCTAAGDQVNPRITLDGSLGAIVTWMDGRTKIWDIYAGRIDSTGKLLWTSDGLPICTLAYDQQNPQITSDGSGGALIAWRDFRSGSNYDIYAQRVDGAGNPSWTVGGVALCTSANNQYGPQIISDGSGGAIITWVDDHPERNFDLYARRVDSTGNPLWTADGVSICTLANAQQNHRTIPDGSGGAIIAWQDNRNGNEDIYAQRIGGTGNPSWTTNGVAVCTSANNQYGPQIISDGSGGAIIAWVDEHPGSNLDIYARRVDSTGTPLGASEGVPICTASNSQSRPQMTSDGSGGTIITWEDNRSGNPDIYAQRIDSSVKPLWTANGVAICTAANNQDYPQITSYGSGDVTVTIITWQDNRSDNFDIYAQRIDNMGNTAWTANGVAVCTAANDQNSPFITSYASLGAIITWRDYRSGNSDIYAQRITKDGELK